jgi:cobalt-zinc-cadmium efflux system outer membrane protein
MKLILRAVRLPAAGCVFLAGCIGAPQPAPIDELVVRPPTPIHSPIVSDEPQESMPAQVLPATQLTPPTTTNVPVDLDRLLRMAAQQNPILKQAAADVAAARGAAVQAGLYPNPTAGYQGDQIGSGHTAGQQGAFVHQTIVTAGKLSLAQAAAIAEVTRTEAAMQQAQADLAADVRAKLFALRAATEAVRITEELAAKSQALYERQQKLLDSGQPVAPHEVSQSKALASVARGEVIQAHNRRTAALKQLAAAVGVAELAAVDAGKADAALPACTFDAIKQRVLESHSDLRAAAAQVERARLQAELARVTPYPNVETNTYVQHDYQTRTPQFGVQIGVALPIFDRNQGNIVQAEANLVRATHEADRVRLDLTRRVTEAFERYSTNRRLLEQYQTTILPDQLKAFDGISKRFEQEPGKVSFSEVVLAQQTLANTYTSYLAVLNNAWQAYAELTRLTQTDDPCTGTMPAGPDSWPDPAKAKR